MTSPPERIRLVVLFGGRSAEHDVSRASASHVLSAIDPDRYEVVPVGITRDGRWQLAEAAAELLGARRALPASVDVEGPQTDPLALAGDLPTVVIPVLHGPNGEDGTVQGMLELAGVAYVGAGVLGSSVAMDKAMAKTVLDAHGIPQPRWRQLLTSDLSRPGLAEELLEDLGPVVFVKPANMGSSIGVSRATDVDGVLAGLEEAARYDERLVVEQGVGTPDEPVRELECGVLGNLSPQASVVGEVIPAAEFYDYDDKYHDGAARTVIPAELDDEVSEHVRSLAIRTFRALRAEGMARVDVFLAPTPGPSVDRVLVNEINTLPGFTPISMFPKLWHASGIDYPHLIDELVRLALERHQRRSRFQA
ncbi:D-alanine--D-alanine ligase family protein [Dermatobacter hominis]|uniref:D-alanine--D-alanine ligase family protein n=1 Tax=Dermatobacter hominis TaxID=2884263 RepID=UPI001D128AD1|nr:D-alanine--D-alanine ligase family protein [Dermatobacter hominis]UDY36076.1 D-alanine--D-alanine ligase [Dermatobacter hominis]